MNNEKSILTIKHGSMILSEERDNLVQVDETSDGVAFQFKNGLNFTYSNSNMPIVVKKTISTILNAPSRENKNNVFVDLLNWKNPIRITQ